MIKIIGRNDPHKGYVLEKESETQYALNRYTKERGTTRLTQDNIEVFNSGTLMEWYITGRLIKEMKKYTKGSGFVIREQPKMINF